MLQISSTVPTTNVFTILSLSSLPSSLFPPSLSLPSLFPPSLFPPSLFSSSLPPFLSLPSLSPLSLPSSLPPFLPLSPFFPLPSSLPPSLSLPLSLLPSPFLSPSLSPPLSPGYVYLTFDSERSVKALLMSCTHDPMDAAQYYFRVSSRRMRDKEVQVISWALSDSNSIRCPSPRLDPSRTVFVGGLHGLINAGE